MINLGVGISQEMLLFKKEVRMDGIAIIGIIVVIFALGHPVELYSYWIGILYVFSEVTELREYGAYIQFAQNFVEERIKRQDFDESRIKEIIEALKRKRNGQRAKQWITSRSYTNLERRIN